MFQSYVFWFVIIAIILVVIYIYSNYDVKTKVEKKSKVEKKNDSESESISESSFSWSVTEDDDEYSYSSYEQLPNEYDVDYTPKLPKHIEDPNYKPDFYYAGGKPSKGELECKAAAERIYGVPFHTIRPDWLRNNKVLKKGSKNGRNRNMEIDCYNEELKFGIEYHGIQHYRYVPHFHKNGISDLHDQIQRDHLKLDLCEKEGVKLIIVPFNVPVDQIENFIKWSDPKVVQQRARLAAIV